HVPGPQLEHVGGRGHALDIARIKHLGDDRQTGLGPSRGEMTEPLVTQPLEVVRSGPGFEGASPKDMPAGGPDGASGRNNLLLALDGAGAGHDDGVAPAHRHSPAEIEAGAGGIELASRELVLAGDRDDALDVS